MVHHETPVTAMGYASEKIRNDTTRISNKVRFNITSPVDRAAITRLIADAADAGKEVQCVAETTGDDGFIETILIQIET